VMVQHSASISQVSALSTSPAPNCCGNFCGKEFEFTPALRSWRSCCTGTANETFRLTTDVSSPSAFMRCSSDPELLHSAAKRVGVKAQDLRRPARALNDRVRLLQCSQNVTPRNGFQALERRLPYAG